MFRKFTKKTIIIVDSILVLIVGGILVTALISPPDAAQQSGMVINPGYSTVLPKGKTITRLGGWQRVSPAGQDPVYAYSDMLGGVSISVSEQPLPESFKNDVSGQIAELAKAYNATDTVNVNGITVYIGTSAKGPQSVIFTQNNLLILIKSQKTISDTTWSSYIYTFN
jgi:hypothetical protein